MALNSEIRNAINKGAGDSVMVTLFLENQNNTQNNMMIFECFKDAGVMAVFQKLTTEEQTAILNGINNLATESQQVEKIVKIIERLEQWNMV